MPTPTSEGAADPRSASTSTSTAGRHAQAPPLWRRAAMSPSVPLLWSRPVRSTLLVTGPSVCRPPWRMASLSERALKAAELQCRSVDEEEQRRAAAPTSLSGHRREEQSAKSVSFGSVPSSPATRLSPVSQAGGRSPGAPTRPTPGKVLSARLLSMSAGCQHAILTPALHAFAPS